MKFSLYRFRLLVILLIFTVSSCTTATPQVSTPLPTPTLTLPLPPLKVTPAPSVDSAAEAFLKAWQAEDYQAMYDLLGPVSQDATAFESFLKRYKDTAINMTLDRLEYKILAASINPASAQVNYQVTFHTRMVGNMTREMTMNFTRVKDAWRVLWDDSLILPELKGGNTLVMDIKSPTRGNIYDRNGNAIAAASEITALWIVKGQTDPNQESTLLTELSKLTGRTPESIKALYDTDRVYDGTLIPVGEVLRSEYNNRYNVLSGLSGLQTGDYTGRFYFNGGIAPHVTGYVSAIQAGDEEEKYKREGFRIDDRVGRSGLEAWGEKYLIGQRGATLKVVDPQGSPITRLGQVEAKPSQSIYSTLDRNLQIEAQKAMSGFSGAIVVMERDTGRVLALVSSPGFDPNAFEFTNPNSFPLLGLINGDGRARQFNRATGNGYPLGSVFKIITMAAAMESGAFLAEDTYDCQHTYNELQGQVMYDWTYTKGYEPSGVLDLRGALMRSCNPWFYHIGVTLYRQGQGGFISEMARAFGLGSLTGIEGVREEAGNMPDPSEELDAARVAIGQSRMQVNPLQVARFVAAIGNGGTLYKPQVVEKIVDLDGNPSFSFQPVEQGKLPLKPETLQVIQDAMFSVVANKRGTAVQAFSGLNIAVFGKTGTAQSDLEAPHAWFAGYSNEQREGKPDIAFAVIAEYAGEGSDIAAPIARRILEVYFMGKPQKVYPWESRVNVTRTPTPLPTNTPVPGQEPQPSGDTSSDPGSSGVEERTPTPEP